MKRITPFIFAIGLLIVSSSCKKQWSEGELTTEDRSITDSISGIHAKGSFDVFITEDTTYDIRIEAGDKVLPYIETYVDDNTLIIREEWNHFIGNKPKRVFVSAYYLSSIHLDGSGNIHADHLSTNSAIIDLSGSGNIDLNYDSVNTVSVALSGSGNIDLSGQCSSSTVNLRGSGNIDCKSLTSVDCVVDLEGSGNCKVTVTDDLTVSLSGSGNVYYWGNPVSVTKDVTGSGNVVEM